MKKSSRADLCWTAMPHPAFRDKDSKLYLPCGTRSVNPGLSRTFRDGWQLWKRYINTRVHNISYSKILCTLDKGKNTSQLKQSLELEKVRFLIQFEIAQ